MMMMIVGINTIYMMLLESLPPSTVRRIMALRINTLANANSGVSVGTFTALINMFNSGCTPFVPEQGTVGASGDLGNNESIVLPI